jgi:hypothetical protein
MPPAAFFGEAVPMLLSRMRAMCQDRGGKFAVVVDGAGAWTLDFEKAEVREGEEEADVRLSMDEETFGSLSQAKVELRKLVVDGAVTCEGEKDRVEDLSLILAFLQG